MANQRKANCRSTLNESLENLGEGITRLERCTVEARDDKGRRRKNCPGSATIVKCLNACVKMLRSKHSASADTVA